MPCSVTCFGTGDGHPCSDRNHASFLYAIGKTRILIDCGEPLDRNYKASGLNYDEIDSILISHMHSDHVGGFFMFMQGLWLEKRRRELPVHLPGGAIKPVREMLKAVLIFDELIKFRLRLLPLREKKAIVIGNSSSRVRITPFCNSHLNGLRARFGKKYRSDFSSYCFLLEGANRRVAHSSDLGKPEDLAPILSKPLDLLICELSHFSPEAIFSYLNGRPIKHVAFVHLSRPLRQNLPKLRRLAAKMLPKITHSFPNDLAEIKF